MDTETRRETAVELARRLRSAHPDARYELDYKTPFQLLVATILAGGSKDAAVNEVTPALFARWPDAKALAAAEPALVEDVLRPLGLAHQKAERLAAVSARLVERFGGLVPRTMEEMLTLPGVQRKTANVVLTNAMAVASGIVVDLHVTRLAQRMGLSTKKKPEAIEEDLMEVLPSSSWIHFGAAAILHGRYHCTAQAPRCSDCFVADLCEKNGVALAEASPPPPAKPKPSATAWPDEFMWLAT